MRCSKTAPPSGRIHPVQSIVVQAVGGTDKFIADNGKMPLMAVDDCGVFVQFIFDNPVRFTGVNLEMGTAQVSWSDITAAFTNVTGRKAIHRRVSWDVYGPRKGECTGEDDGNKTDHHRAIPKRASELGESGKSNTSNHDLAAKFYCLVEVLGGGTWCDPRYGVDGRDPPRQDQDSGRMDEKGALSGCQTRDGAQRY
jgi:hypothetical protein